MGYAPHTALREQSFADFAPDTSFCYAMAEKSKSRIGESFNFFVSLEVKKDPDHRNFLNQVEEFQARTLSMFPEQQTAKAAKLSSLHITLATLLVHEDEMAYPIHQ